MKKAISFILALLMIFGTAVSTFAAVVKPVADATAVKAGENISVKIELDQKIENILQFEYSLYFDSNVFDLESSAVGAACPAAQISKVKNDKKGSYYSISFLDAASEGQTINAGTIFTLNFKAKEDISEQKMPSFKLEKVYLTNGDFEQVDDGNVEGGEFTVTVSPASCDHVGTETETTYTAKGDGNHTVTVTCKKCGEVISTTEEACAGDEEHTTYASKNDGTHDKTVKCAKCDYTVSFANEPCTKGEEGKCTYCGYVFPEIGEDEYVITVKVAPATVNVTFYGDENAETALAENKVTDKGTDESGKYHVYEVTVPAGMYSYRAVDTADSANLGGMTFEAPVSAEIGSDGKPISTEQTMTLVRVNYYTTNKNVTAVGDYSIEIMPGKMKSVVTGAQYINSSAKVVTPTLLYAHGNALLYSWKVTLNEELSKTYGVAPSINNIFAESLALTQNKTFNLSNLVEYSVTAPSQADVRFFNQLKNFNVEELPAASNNDNGDGTTTYTLSAVGNSLTYRVSMAGKTTKAGYLASKTPSVTVTFGTDENPKSTANKMDNASLAAYVESSTMLNVNGKNELSLGVGETFRLRAYRGAWQIVNTTTGNIMIEPDFNYTVISGGEHIKMTPATNRCTGNAGIGEQSNWMDIEGVSAGITVLEVSYDAIDIVSGTTFTGTYGATDPKRTSLVIIRVGEDAGELSLKAAGVENTWDTEYDTVYTLEDTAAFDFTASLDGAVPEVQLSTDKGMSWKDVSKNEDGSFTAAGLIEGNNILKFTANGKTAYQVVRAAKVTYTVTNDTRGGSTAYVGDNVSIVFKGLYQPVAKFSGIYNPGFMTGHQVAYELPEGVTLVKASGGQYNFISTNKYTITSSAEGTTTLTGGNVKFTVMGTDAPNGGHRILTDNGVGANFSAVQTAHIRDVMPDISIDWQVYHDWSIDYEWSSDNKTCTATRTCSEHESETVTETVNTVYSVVKAAACEAKGEGKYVATFTNAAFEEQEKTVEIPATDHDWAEPTYEWSADHSTLTGKVVCENDSNHVHTETVNSTAVTENATCTEKGKVTYTAEFGENKYGFTTQTAVVENAVLGHDWGETEYTWNSDNSEVTAKHTCKRDPAHTEEETVKTVYSVVKAATCEAKGEGKYVATFTNAAFEEQEKTVEIPATDHDWAEPTYEWSSDNKTCTAKRVCKNDRSHIESETVNSVYSVVKAAACEAKGEGKYVATFTNAAFEEQEKTVEIPATDHDWAEPTYEWSSDNKTCTAKRVCKNDKAHEQTQSVNTVSKTLKEATCAEKGSVEYTADFGNNNYGFVKQSKTVETAALGHKLEHHDAKAATCVAEGNVEYWECSVCNKFFSDKEGKNELNTVVTDKDTKNHVGETEVKDYKEATCSESGYTGDTYCKSCGKLIAAGKVSPVVPHKFGEWKVTKQPTKNSAGEKVRYCEVCQYEQKIEIPRLSDGDVIHIGIGDSKGEQNPETGAQVPGGIAAIAVVAAAAVIFGKKKRG